MTPSVVATSDAGNGIGGTAFRLRGSDASRINVTTNGVPMNDAESHSVYWYDTPDMALRSERSRYSAVPEPRPTVREPSAVR